VIDSLLSYSQLKVWLSCRRQWEYQYLKKYRAKQPALEYMRGSLLHFGMQSGLIERNHGAGTGSDWGRKGNPHCLARARRHSLAHYLPRGYADRRTGGTD